MDAMTTDLAADELITEIAIPVAPQNCRTAFREISRRHGDFAIVAVAAQASMIVLGLRSAASKPCRDFAVA